MSVTVEGSVQDSAGRRGIPGVGGIAGLYGTGCPVDLGNIVKINIVRKLIIGSAAAYRKGVGKLGWGLNKVGIFLGSAAEGYFFGRFSAPYLFFLNIWGYFNSRRAAELRY